jgi:WD40 repeat protein
VGADHRKQIGEPLIRHAKPVKAVAFSPDRVWLASTSDANTIRLWNSAVPNAALGEICNCAITIVQWDSDPPPTLVSFNDTGHL